MQMHLSARPVLCTVSLLVELLGHCLNCDDNGVSLPSMSKRIASKSNKISLPVPPAEEPSERIHIHVPKSLKWKARLRLLELESQGSKTTITDYVISLLEADLNQSNNSEVR